MATHRLPIGFGSLFPDNEFASFIPYDLVDTGTTRNAIVLNFDAASDGEVSGTFEVPQNWVGTTNLIVKWTSEGTSGNFDIEFLHRAVADTQRVDTNTTPATQTNTLIAAAPTGSAGELEEDSISLTTTDWAVGEMIQFQFRRDANDATNDTLASDAQVWQLLIEYSDT